jgi:hypothetical protein
LQTLEAPAQQPDVLEPVAAHMPVLGLAWLIAVVASVGRTESSLLWRRYA